MRFRVLNPHPIAELLYKERSGITNLKRKSVIISKSCSVRPYWSENQELHHISLVTCITAACIALRPLCLSCRARMDNDHYQRYIFQYLGRSLYF